MYHAVPLFFLDGVPVFPRFYRAIVRRVRRLFLVGARDCRLPSVLGDDVINFPTFTCNFEYIPQHMGFTTDGNNKANVQPV